MCLERGGPCGFLWELCQCAITTMRARYAMRRVVALWHRGSRGCRRGAGGSSGTGTGSGMTRNLPMQGRPTIRCKQTTDQEGIPPHKEARLTARQLNSLCLPPWPSAKDAVTVLFLHGHKDLARWRGISPEIFIESVALHWRFQGCDSSR